MANSLASVYPCATFRMRFEEDSSFRLVFKEDNDFCTKMDKITFRVLDPPEYYTGPYEVTPSEETQTLGTNYKTMTRDVVVNPIPSDYIDTSDATVDASEVLFGEVAYGEGIRIVGTMPERGNLGTVTLDANTTSYSIPSGHVSGGTVQIVEESKSITPSTSAQTIMPTSGKVITQVNVDAIQTESETVTPTESQQTITPSQGHFFDSVTVEPIPEEYADTSDTTIDASEVLSGEVAYGYDNVEQKAVKIVGTMPERGNLGTITLDTNTTSYSVPNGHINSGTVQIVLEQKSATPTKSTQTINPSSGKVLSLLTVNPIPAAYQDVTEVDAVASDVLYGKKIVDSSGTVLVGSMPNRGAFVGTIDGLNTMSCAIPQGYHNGNGSVSLTNDIENELDEILNGASE